MDDMPSRSAAPTATTDVPPQRSCTRCDGQQHLVGGHERMGKYRCDRCELVIGFDLDADPAEFLIDRGTASRYTKNVFGSHLLGHERRLS